MPFALGFWEGFASPPKRFRRNPSLQAGVWLHFRPKGRGFKPKVSFTINDPAGEKRGGNRRFPDAFDLTSPLDAARYLSENNLPIPDTTKAWAAVKSLPRDIGVGALKGAVGVPQAAAGLGEIAASVSGSKTGFGDHLNTAAILAADLHSGGRLHRQAEKEGRNLFEPLVDFKAAQDVLNTWHSDDYQKQQTAL